MTLESGTINAIDCNGGYAVRNYAGSKFTMNGGTIATTYEDGDIPGVGYDACPVRVDEGAEFIMNAGTINNISNYTVAVDNYGTTTINGGTLTTIHTTIANSGTMTINGGTFTCNGLKGVTAHAVWAAEGTLTINGGTFNGKDNYNGFNVNASKGAVVYIKGGNFLSVHSGSLYGEGTIAVSGGTFFDAVPENRCAEGYIPTTNSDGTYGVFKMLAIYGPSLVTTGVLQMNIYLDPANEYDGTDYYVVIKVDGEFVSAVAYDKWSTDEYGNFFIPVNVPSVQMVDEISAQIFKGVYESADTYAASEVYTDSVVAYAMYIIGEELYSDTLKSLLVSMLNYGAG
jgi:uncharacterized Zn-binding protein involved in type VI secretion